MNYTRLKMDLKVVLLFFVFIVISSKPLLNREGRNFVPERSLPLVVEDQKLEGYNSPMFKMFFANQDYFDYDESFDAEHPEFCDYDYDDHGSPDIGKDIGENKGEDPVKILGYDYTFGFFFDTGLMINSIDFFVFEPRGIVGTVENCGAINNFILNIERFNLSDTILNNKVKEKYSKHLKTWTDMAQDVFNELDCETAEYYRRRYVGDRYAKRRSKIQLASRSSREILTLSNHQHLVLSMERWRKVRHSDEVDPSAVKKAIIIDPYGTRIVFVEGVPHGLFIRGVDQGDYTTLQMYLALFSSANHDLHPKMVSNRIKLKISACRVIEGIFTNFSSGFRHYFDVYRLDAAEGEPKCALRLKGELKLFVLLFT